MISGRAGVGLGSMARCPASMFDPWTRRPGPTSPGWSRPTTACGAAAGAWASTPRGSGPEQDAGGATARRRSAASARAAPTPRSSTTATDCVGWCQFGSPDELPRIKHKRAYLEEPREPPDWRITCFFVGKGHRGKGVAARALEGALELIAGLGGGTVESFPERVEDRKTSGSFLHNATLSMFERQGFERTPQIGKHRWIVIRDVPAKRPS